QLHFYVINAHKVASETGMGGRINTVMQTCFFALSGILPREQAIAQIKQSIRKTYGKRGEAVVQRNFQAVDETLANLYQVSVPIYEDIPLVVGVASASGAAVSAMPPHQRKPLPMLQRRPPVSPEAPDFVRRVLGPMIAGEG